MEFLFSEGGSVANIHRRSMNVKGKAALNASTAKMSGVVLQQDNTSP